MASRTPIDALREHLPQTVRVRILNALVWAGVESVEELAGADERALIQLNLQGGGRGKLGKKSAAALANAVRVVMAQKRKSTPRCSAELHGLVNDEWSIVSAWGDRPHGPGWRNELVWVLVSRCGEHKLVGLQTDEMSTWTRALLRASAAVAYEMTAAVKSDAAMATVRKE